MADEKVFDSFTGRTSGNKINAYDTEAHNDIEALQEENEELKGEIETLNETLTESEKTHEMLIYTSLASIGLTVNDVESRAQIANIISADSTVAAELCMSVSAGQSTTLYDNQLIPVASAGTFILRSLLTRCHTLYFTDTCAFYASAASNSSLTAAWSDWKQLA